MANRELTLQDARRICDASHGMAFDPLCPIDHNTLMMFNIRNHIYTLPAPAHCNDIQFEVDADGTVRASTGKHIEMRWDRIKPLEEKMTLVVLNMRPYLNSERVKSLAFKYIRRG